MISDLEDLIAVKNKKQTKKKSIDILWDIGNACIYFWLSQLGGHGGGGRFLDGILLASSGHWPGLPSPTKNTCPKTPAVPGLRNPVLRYSSNLYFLKPNI